MDPTLERLKKALAHHYRVDVRVGQGGMAEVYAAEDLQHGRTVAIKVMRPEVAHAVGVERFEREIRAAAGFAHPFILPMLDSGQAAGQHFYVMPYVAGGTLRDRLDREHRLPIDDVVQIGQEVAEALAYAHQRGVVHRDIKPENILFYEGHATVADFGIARLLHPEDPADPRSTDGLMIGTPLYISPEQATSSPVDGRADIYSLGCVLYEMLLGHPPFEGADAQEIIARHLNDPVPSICSVRAKVPDALERVVRQALEKVPADRFSTAGHLAQALRSPPAVADAAPSSASIAVLPFANLSADAAAWDYLSEGIPTEIINALTQITGLRVAARMSSFTFRGRDVDLADVGAKLHVAAVLEGTVQTWGDRIKITAQLVKVRDGYQVWSEKYDRRMADLFEIQEEIANAIVRRLRVTFIGRAAVTPPTQNLDAYHLYLKGRHCWDKRGPWLKDAYESFSQALALDPGYALAHAGLADACALLAQYGLAPPGKMLLRARAAAARAIELAPDLAEAHCAAGTLALLFDWEWRRAEDELYRAIELNPHYDAAQYWLAFYLVFIAGRFSEGVPHAQRAAELDPLAALPAAQLGLVLIGAGRYEEAVATLHRAIALDGDLFLPRLMLGVLYDHLGRSEEAFALLETAVTKSSRHPWTLAALAVCASSLGLSTDVEGIGAELVVRGQREYIQSSMLALVEAAAGRMDNAFALLHRACDERDGILFYSKRYPAFRTLLEDPRMQEIYARIGIPS
jgi:eukaryotic-like serine/threonine-protein kinase